MADKIQGTIEEWSTIKSIANGKFKTSIKLQDDKRYFGIFDDKFTPLDELTKTMPQGSRVEFENITSGNFNNVVSKTLKLIEPGTEIQPNKQSEPIHKGKADWDAIEKRKTKKECLTKATGFLNLCAEQGLIKDGIVVDETKFNNFQILWLKTTEKATDYIYSTIRVDSLDQK